MISKRQTELLPLFLFGGVTLLGICFIMTTKLAGLSPVFSMIIPVVLMTIYWFLSWYLQRLRLHDEQTGDNLYYMGFLFTLTSLGVSLFQFNADGGMDEVVRNFGIAIASTIFGIAMRILYNQTRRDPLDIERATRHDLATMARQVKSEMENMRREFSDFRRINNQMVVEGVTEIMEATKETATKVRATLEDMVRETVKPLENASHTFGDAIGKSLGDISDKLSVVVDKLDATTKQVEDVMLPEAVIRNDLAPLIKELGTTLNDYASKAQQAGNNQAAQSKAMSDSVAKLVEQMGRTSAMMEKTVQGTAALAQRVEQSTATNRQMFERILRDGQRGSVVFSGGIPARPSSAAPPIPRIAPSENYQAVRPEPPSMSNGFQTLNPSSYPIPSVSAAMVETVKPTAQQVSATIAPSEEQKLR